MELTGYMYEKIFNDLRKKIISGEYAVGFRLPAEKELSEQYQVSRITSKKAMDMLAERGMIQRERGRGSFVLGKDAWKIDEKLIQDTMELGNSEISHVAATKTTHQNRKLIGLILDNFNDNFGSNLLKNVIKEASRKGFEVCVRCSYGNQKAENEAIEKLLETGAFGILLVSVQNETYNESLLRLVLNHYPAVLIDRKMTGIKMPCITTDNYTAARQLTKILIEHGNRRICMLTHSWFNTPTIKDRYHGFVDCIMEYNDVIGRRCILESYYTVPALSMDQETMYKICEEEMTQLILDNDDCTGYIAVETNLAWILSRTLNKLNKKKDIVYFDPFTYGWIDMSLACIRQDEHEMGKRAIETLEKIISGETVKEDNYVDYQLIEGNKGPAT